jgi:hypothetical protein
MLNGIGKEMDCRTWKSTSTTFKIITDFEEVGRLCGFQMLSRSASQSLLFGKRGDVAAIVPPFTIALREFKLGGNGERASSLKCTFSVCTIPNNEGASVCWPEDYSEDVSRWSRRPAYSNPKAILGCAVAKEVLSLLETDKKLLVSSELTLACKAIVSGNAPAVDADVPLTEATSPYSLRFRAAYVKVVKAEAKPKRKDTVKARARAEAAATRKERKKLPWNDPLNYTIGSRKNPRQRKWRI